MDFRLSDEQALLKESAEGWLARSYQFDQWRTLTERTPPFSEENWRTFAEMGWLGLAMPERLGGLGFGALDRMVLAEAFGYRLVAEPYLSTVVLGGGILLASRDEAQQGEWLPRIAEGEAKLAFAFAERKNRFSLSLIETRASKSEDGYLISGEKILVLDAPSSDRIIVSARTSGSPSDKDGCTLFLVDPKAQGVSMRSYRTVDDRVAADVVFENVPAAALIGEEGHAYEVIEQVSDEALGYLCAEGVGAMQALYDTTLSYVRTRKQFGQAIGDFQVIQHRIVALRVQIECSRAMTAYAASLAGSTPAERGRAASAAKAQVARSARIVGADAIQLHGGIGMTNELSVGQYFKRLSMVQTFLGDVDFHQRRFAELE